MCHKSSLSVTLFVTLVLFIICWAIWAAIHIRVTHKSQGPLAQSNTGTHATHSHLLVSPSTLCLSVCPTRTSRLYGELLPAIMSPRAPASSSLSPIFRRHQRGSPPPPWRAPPSSGHSTAVAVGFRRAGGCGCWIRARWLRRRRDSRAAAGSSLVTAASSSLVAVAGSWRAGGDGG
jgi:hypothetical protein